MHALRTTTRRLGLILLATLALALAACSAGPAESSSGGALVFTGTTVDGGDFDAETLAGTPTIMWFWAPF